MASCDLRTPTSDRGDIVLGWLVKIVVILAVFGVVAFDAISIGTTKMSVEDQGDTAARAASETWQRTHDARASLADAQKAAAEANPLNVVVPESFAVDADGTAHFTIEREASTLVAQHIGPLRKVCLVDAAAIGRSTA
ncbi:hypothetical protein [Angustibacter peucedani]